MSTILGLFADNLLPILLAATAGYLLARTLKLNPRPIAQVVFYVFSPALIFDILLTSEISAQDMLRMVSLALLIVLITGALSWGIGRALRLSPKMISAFILASALMNAGNYGLPLNRFAFGQAGLALASIFFVTNALLSNSLGVFIASVGTRTPIQALVGLSRVPAVYAIPLALVFRGTGWTLPLSIQRPVTLLASAAIPCMLVLLGMQVASNGLPKNKRLLVLTVAIRLILSPALAWVLAPALGLTGVARSAGILEAAMPTAVYATVLALQFDVEPDFATGAVLATTLLSPLTVTPLIAILGGG